MNKPSRAEILASLKELREGCAACFRVLVAHGLEIETEDELFYARVAPGFGVRAQQLIARMEEEENAQQIQRGRNHRSV